MKQFAIAFVVLAGVLCFMFSDVLFVSDNTMFSNDGPLGEVQRRYQQRAEAPVILTVYYSLVALAATMLFIAIGSEPPQKQ